MKSPKLPPHKHYTILGPVDCHVEDCDVFQIQRRQAQARYKRTARGMLTDLRYEATRRGNR